MTKNKALGRKPPEHDCDKFTYCKEDEFFGCIKSMDLPFNQAKHYRQSLLEAAEELIDCDRDNKFHSDPIEWNFQLAKKLRKSAGVDNTSLVSKKK